MRKIVLLLVLAGSVHLGYHQTGYAQDALPEMSTDRPDQTESSSVVTPGTVQIETGVVFEQDSEGEGASKVKTTVLSYPTTLVRIGLLKSMELRLVGSLASQTVKPEQGEEISASGVSEVEIGTKLYIAEEDGILPEIALNLHMALPIGDDAFRIPSAAPHFRFLFSHTLSDMFGIGYNIGGEWDGATPAGSLVYTLSLAAGLTDELGCFAEVFGSKPSEQDVNMAFDAGVTYLLSPNFQLDASFGVPLTDDAPVTFVSAGVSLRLPR